MSAEEKEAAAELAVVKEAYDAFDGSGEIEGEVKGHFVGGAHVQLYVDLAFSTQLITLKRSPEDGWVATYDAADDTEMHVRDERHRMAREWTPLN